MKKAKKVKSLATAKGKSSGEVKLPEISANARIQYGPTVTKKLGDADWDILRSHALPSFPKDKCHAIHFVVEGVLAGHHQEVSVWAERGYEALCDELIDVGLARITFSRLRVELNRVEMEIIVVGSASESAIREEVMPWLETWIQGFFKSTAEQTLRVGKISREEAQSDLIRMAYEHERDNADCVESFKRLNPDFCPMVVPA